MPLLRKEDRQGMGKDKRRDSFTDHIHLQKEKEVLMMKEDIRLIMADVDGTLLNDEKKVTPRTAEAIRSLKEKGIRFGIATGRSPYAVRLLVHDWGIADCTDLILGFNGGAIYDVKSGKMQEILPLSGDAVKQLKKDLAGFACVCGVYDREEFHVTKRDARTERTAVMNHFTLVEDDLDHYETVNKVLVTADPDVIVKIMEWYPQEEHIYSMAPSAKDRIEVVNPELTKSKGMAVLCEQEGLKPENVLTFGDMMNDYEMIRDYTGVAMGNADPKIKEAAKYITASNNEDGIAVFIKDYL